MARPEHPKGVAHMGKYFLKSSILICFTTLPVVYLFAQENETPETRRFSRCGFVFLVNISLEFDRFAARERACVGELRRLRP